MKSRSQRAVELSEILDDSESLARGLKIEDRRQELGKLLTFEANLSRPVHRWYKFKEGFSETLVERLLSEFRPPARRTLSFLDPFCGVGTSLLAANSVLSSFGARDISLRGVEVNPYMHFVTTTKLDWHRYDPVFLLRAAAMATNGVALRSRPSIPDLSTLQNDKFISREDLRRILELREKVRVVAKGHRELRPLLLGLAVGAERAFNLRKDGRALRFVPRPDAKTVDEEIDNAWTQIAEDLQSDLGRPLADWWVARGDGRRADRVFEGDRFDVILFSPPYLNNIDYTEVYKIEQWLLGFLNSSSEMVSQRRRTFRSHPSCLFPGFKDVEDEDAVVTLGMPFRRLLDYAACDEPWRRRLFLGYFADMLRTLQSCRRLLNDRGRLFLVIGNSVHGVKERPIPVAADLWTARLARAAGLHVEAILVGRSLPRRRMDWSGFRESVIVMSKAPARGH